MRKVCVYSSTRADYGLLFGLITKIAASPQLMLQLMVSGTHLVAEQGMTIREIQADGFSVDQTVDINLTDDTPQGICNSMGMALAKYGQSLMQLRPEVLVILGDRFESFCCAAAANVCRIPIAHIHGGETTQGAMDEAFRHAITKMAHLHFPCCEAYRKRVIQLGEPPDRVFNVGALSIENIRRLNLINKAQLERKIGVKLDRPFFLITFHPVTLETGTAAVQFAELTAALDQFPEYMCIFTYANADTDGRTINAMIQEYTKLHQERCWAIPSMGLINYLSAMSLCQAVIGNSSSGIVEAPALGTPTVNIGDRQKGRIRAKSVIDCDPHVESICKSILRVLSYDFKQSIKGSTSPFEMNGTSDLIAEYLLSFDFRSCIKKPFFDLDFQNPPTVL